LRTDTLRRRFLPLTPGTVALLDFAVILILALTLRLYGLGAKPLWLDEVTTAMRVNLPLSGLIADSFRNHHLPTYFLLVSLFSPGASVWLMRLPSAVAGAFAAALGGAVGRTLGGRIAGAMSGLLLATAPVMVQFGQDARPYALILACLTLAIWGLVRLATDPQAAGGSWANGRGPWLAFALGSWGALAVGGDAAPFLLVANLATWPLARGIEPALRRRFLLRWVGVQAAVLLAVAPLYVAMNHAVTGQYLNSFAWIPPPDALRLWRIAADMYLLRAANLVSLHLLPASLPGLGLIAPLLAVVGAAALGRRSAARAVLLLAVLALPVVLFLAHPIRPLWLPRYLLWSGAAFLILAGLGAAWLAGRRPAIATAAAAVLLVVNLLPYYRGETAPPWNLAAAALTPALAAGADVLVDDGAVSVMLRAGLPGGKAALPPEKVLYHLSQARAQLKAGVPVIAVHGPVGQGWTSTESAFRVRMRRIGTPAQETRIGQEILLIRFNPLPRPHPGSLEANVRQTH
jgi:mannosyltransferase